MKKNENSKTVGTKEVKVVTSIKDSDPNTTEAGKKVVASGTPNTSNTKTSEPITLESDGKMDCFRFSANTCSVDKFPYYIALKNVRNIEYVRNAVEYRNILALIQSMTTAITKLSSDRDSSQTAEEKEVLSKMIASLENLKSIQEQKRDDFKETHADHTKMIEDTFILLLAHDAFNVEMKVPDSLIDRVMSALENHSKARNKGSFSTETKQLWVEVQKAVQAVFEHYNTDKSEYYWRSHVKANRWVIDHMICIYERPVKRNRESGKNMKAEHANKKVISTELIRIAIAILQGGIETARTTIEREDSTK